MEINRDNIYTSYINLKERGERNERMIKELDRVGLKAERFEAYPWKELWDNGTPEQRYNWGYMHNIRKTPGAIGCWASMISVMKIALKQGKHALILEDDVQFADDLQERFDIIFEFLNKHSDFDVFWLGGHYHWSPEWHKSINGMHTHREIVGLCNCNLNRDWEPTDNKWINRTYGCFSTMAWIINKDKIQEHIDLMYKHMHYEMGIDHFYIVHQPNMKCYAFNPGCAKQYSSMSSIGNGFSNQDFSSLGRHWFSRKKDVYLPD